MRHLHLGLGRFHRCHQAVYFQRLGGPKVSAFSMRSPNEAEALARADHQYQVLILSGRASEVLTINVIDEARFALQERERLYELLADPEVQTVTLTVTEKGYCADNEGKLNAQGLEPTSLPGLLVKGLEKRGQNPITILSCDNLSDNGRLLRSVCLQWAQRFAEPELLSYLEEGVAFPNSMVDRIVPALSKEQEEQFRQQHPLSPAPMLATEEFTQWVIEDAFAGPRPSWAQPGLIFTDRVEPFEKLKLRLLNASHSFLAYYGQLQGHEFVHQAVADKAISSQLRQLTLEEVGPYLEAPSGVKVEDYCEQILARFDNPHLPHRLAQIGMDGSLKIPLRILGSLLEAQERGSPHTVLSTALHAWLKYMWLGLSGQRDLFISDPAAERMRSSLGSDFPQTVQNWVFEEKILGATAADQLSPRSILMERERTPHESL